MNEHKLYLIAEDKHLNHINNANSIEFCFVEKFVNILLRWGARWLGG